MKTCLFFLFLFRASGIAQESKTDAIGKKVNALFESTKSRSEEQAAFDKGLVLWDKEMNRVYSELMQGSFQGSGEPVEKIAAHLAGLSQPAGRVSG
jgi:hypothetical protein